MSEDGELAGMVYSNAHIFLFTGAGRLPGLEEGARRDLGDRGGRPGGAASERDLPRRALS